MRHPVVARPLRAIGIVPRDRTIVGNEEHAPHIDAGLHMVTITIGCSELQADLSSQCGLDFIGVAGCRVHHSALLIKRDLARSRILSTR